MGRFVSNFKWRIQVIPTLLVAAATTLGLQSSSGPGADLETRFKHLEARVLQLELQQNPEPAFTWDPTQNRAIIAHIDETLRNEASPRELAKAHKLPFPEFVADAMLDTEIAMRLAFEAQEAFLYSRPLKAAALCERSKQLFNRHAERIGYKPFPPE